MTSCCWNSEIGGFKILHNFVFVSRAIGFLSVMKNNKDELRPSFWASEQVLALRRQVSS